MVKLGTDIEDAQAQASQQRAVSRQAHPELVQWQPEGVVLTFHSDPNYELNLDSLERLGTGIDLLSCKEERGVQIAKVFVHEGRLNEYLKLVNAYGKTNIVFTNSKSASMSIHQWFPPQDQQLPLSDDSSPPPATSART